jgi:hypothetical protein
MVLIIVCYLTSKTNKGKKKGQKSGHTKKKNSKIKNPNLRRSTKALGNGSDISAKLFATMEKHKEVCSEAYLDDLY